MLSSAPNPCLHYSFYSLPSLKLLLGAIRPFLPLLSTWLLHARLAWPLILIFFHRLMYNLPRAGHNGIMSAESNSIKTSCAWHTMMVVGTFQHTSFLYLGGTDLYWISLRQGRQSGSGTCINGTLGQVELLDISWSIGSGSNKIDIWDTFFIPIAALFRWWHGC